MKCIKCPISKICSQDYSVNCRYSLKMYQQGRADERARVFSELEKSLDENGYGHDGNLGDIIDKLKENLAR